MVEPLRLLGPLVLPVWLRRALNVLRLETQPFSIRRKSLYWNWVAIRVTLLTNT